MFGPTTEELSVLISAGLWDPRGTAPGLKRSPISYVRFGRFRFVGCRRALNRYVTGCGDGLWS